MPAKMNGPIPRRPLGKTGAEVSLLCLGGYHLGLAESPEHAERLVHAALDGGVDFFDNAWEYHDGKSEDWLGRALRGRRDRAFVMSKVCSHGRDAGVAMQMLEDSLRRLQTDHLDLWQIHEVIYENDPERHYRAGGVLEAFDRARQQGKVRFVGFTGHKDPSMLLEMLTRGYHFDTVQMPLNCFDGAGFRSFERQVLPEALARGTAALAMKAMGADGRPLKKGAVTAAEALGYAMSLPVASVVSGMESMTFLEQNLALAGGFVAWTEDELQRLRDKVAAVAADGRFELHKTSKRHDGPLGRAEHGFPSPEKLGA